MCVAAPPKTNLFLGFSMAWTCAVHGWSLPASCANPKKRNNKKEPETAQHKPLENPPPKKQNVRPIWVAVDDG